MVGNFEILAILLIGLVSIVLPMVVLVVLFLIYSKLNAIEKLLSKKDE
jgi:lipopolysaccharide export LptBFGC system permease protein LptF